MESVLKGQFDAHLFGSVPVYKERFNLRFGKSSIASEDQKTARLVSVLAHVTNGDGKLPERLSTWIAERKVGKLSKWETATTLQAKVRWIGQRVWNFISLRFDEDDAQALFFEELQSADTKIEKQTLLMGELSPDFGKPYVCKILEAVELGHHDNRQQKKTREIIDGLIRFPVGTDVLKLAFENIKQMHEEENFFKAEQAYRLMQQPNATQELKQELAQVILEGMKERFPDQPKLWIEKIQEFVSDKAIAQAVRESGEEDVAKKIELAQDLMAIEGVEEEAKAIYVELISSHVQELLQKDVKDRYGLKLLESLLKGVGVVQRELLESILTTAPQALDSSAPLFQLLEPSFYSMDTLVAQETSAARKAELKKLATWLLNLKEIKLDEAAKAYLKEDLKGDEAAAIDILPNLGKPAAAMQRVQRTESLLTLPIGGGAFSPMMLGLGLFG